MIKPKIPDNEKDRLKSLDAYEIIGTAENEDFDFLTSMAAEICGTKISLISLVTEDKQWFLSHHGLQVRETPKEYSFCAHAINNPSEPFIVENSSDDQRFFDNPLVTGQPHVAFYAGIPLVSGDGFALGSLCVIDESPKQLTDHQIAALKKLAAQTERLLELRKKTLQFEALSNKQQLYLELLNETQRFNKIGAWELDIETGQTVWTYQVYDIHEIPQGFDHNKVNGIEFYHPEDRPIITEALTKAIKNNDSFDVTCRLITAKNNLKWVKSTGRKVDDKIIGSFQDITEIKQNELKFKGIFNSSFSFIGFLNTNGILLDINDTSLEQTGIKAEDVIGKYFWDAYWWQISEETKAKVKTSFEQAAAGKHVIEEIVMWYANEAPATILFSMKPIYDDQGNIIYVLPEGRSIDDIVEARNRYKYVLEGTNVGTWEWNVQTGETIFNERWAEIVGYTLKELEPINIDTWMNIAHPDDLEESKRKLNECFEKKTEYYEMEVRMKHKDSHWVWVLARGKVSEWTKDGQPLKMFGTHQDITIRKTAELGLTYNENILQTLFDLSPIGIALNDYETGAFIDLNEKLLEPTGYTKDEFMGLSYWDVTPKEYAAEEEKALKNMEEIGSYGPFEKEYIRKDGSRYPVLLRGVVVEDINQKKFIWSFIQDISKEKEAERKLHEAIGKLQAILDASTQVSIIATDKEGVITQFNSGAERMLGYKASEMVGKCTPEIMHVSTEIAEHAEALQNEYQMPIEGFDVFVYKAKKGIFETKEWNYITKDGALLPVLLSVTAINEGEEIIGYLGVAADISELKKAQSEIQSLLDITKDQNDRLLNFAHIVTHNLRNHVTGFQGWFDIIKDEDPEIYNHEPIQYLKKISDNLEITITDLTEIVKTNLNEPVFKAVNLSEIVHKNLESLSSKIKDEHFNIINLIEENTVIQSVPAYIDSIVLNFITNAIKYRSKERDSYLKISSTRTHNTTQLIFEDNGQGIDLKKYGDKLFGLYQRFHMHEDSRGVGLFITKNQIEAMGGSVEVESAVDVGTTFIITLLNP